ncbi:hypothetical protein ACLB2K_055749 [Fragaria x ananassa]
MLSQCKQTKSGGDISSEMEALRVEDLDSSTQIPSSMFPKMSYASSLKNSTERFSQTMSEEFDFIDADCTYSMGLRRKWQTRGGWQLIDLPNDFFIVKFNLEEDINYALCGGPWIIAGQTLVVQKWRPGFNPDCEVIGKMALWVRILDLPVKFFKDFTVAKIGKILGDVVKVDPLTIGIFMICFECGCFGHPKDKCPSIVTASADVSSYQDPSEVENVPNAQSEVEMHASEDIVKEDMGPWMLLTYRNKKKNGNSGGSKNLNASGSRFFVLQEEEINEKVPNVENDADMPSGDTPNIVKLWNNFQDKKKNTSKPKNNLSSTSNPKSPVVTGKSSPKPSKVLHVNSAR